MAALYDETRRFDKRSFDSALDYLVKRLPPLVFANVFEPGIGTGRLAIPLAERGYHVTGVDISPGMLAGLQGRLVRVQRYLLIGFQLADVLYLPYADDVFDMVIVTHLFYFIRRCRMQWGNCYVFCGKMVCLS